MAFIAMTTADMQIEQLVNTDTISTVGVTTNHRVGQRVLRVTFTEGTSVDYRPVTPGGGLEDAPEHKPASDLLGAFRAYMDARGK
ncbi:hypothetical protein GCM10028787_30990 [Brachybacterium horti]